MKIPRHPPILLQIERMMTSLNLGESSYSASPTTSANLWIEPASRIGLFCTGAASGPFCTELQQLMMIGGLSECWHGGPLVPEVWDTHVPGGQTALSSLQGKVGCHWLKMRTCGPSLSRPMQEKLGCAKRLAGSSEDCSIVLFKIFPMACGPRCDCTSHWIASLPH